MTFDPQAPLPFRTHDLPGIGGKVKVQPEDFEVEEIPAYEPCGEGEHLYLWIEKRDMGAEYFARQIARRLEIPTSAIGTAGLKDRRAVTRQWVSLPQEAEERLPQLEGDGLRVLKTSRHANKLRPGHLKGNRFNVLIREPEAPAPMDRLLDVLNRYGLPNYYGPQRFGRDGETARIGFSLLRGETTKPSRLSPFLRKLALSAAQSALFNQYLRNRQIDCLLDRVMRGDVMQKLPFGGLFVVTESSLEQQRFDARDIVHTGPMYGRKMFSPAADAAEREAAVLEEAGLSLKSFHGFGKLMQGTRRSNIVHVQALYSSVEKDGIRLTFTLPVGSYASVLLREVMKTTVADEPESC